MDVTEPRTTAALLLVVGAVLVASALLSRLSARSGIPLVLGFVGLGMLCGSEAFSVAEIPFPEGSAAMLLLRGDELLAPRGNTEFQPGDVVHVFCRAGDRPLLELLFGKPSAD